MSRTDTPTGDEAETAAVSGSPMSVDPPAFLPTVLASGSTLGRYAILEQIGEGGMGRVLRAYDPKLQREVALKLVRGDHLDARARARVVREARAMAKVSHPNVVAVYDVEDELDADRDVGVVLVMQYVPGETLRGWMRHGGRPSSEIIAVFVQAGRGLAAAHAEGLLHRDFKPANVLVDRHAVKVTDFGLAKLADDQSSGHSHSLIAERSTDSSSDALTQAGTVMGTPRYMAPEQHAGDALGPAADQYAFCVALWEALVGEPPFSGRHLAAQKAKGAPPWPGVRLPGPITQALRRGLAVDPTDRWPNMEALLQALTPRRRRRSWALAASAFAVIGVGGLGLRSWVGVRAQRCTGAQTQLGGGWDDARRAAVEAAFLETGTVYSESVWTGIEPQLDAYARDWTAMHTEACEATTIRGEQSTEVMDLRMACLHRAKIDFIAVTEVLATADASVVQRAHQTVAGLARLSKCADVDGLQADVEPPPPEDSDAVERIRAHLAAAKARREAGRVAEAMDAVEQAEVELARVDYDPVRTELLLERGVVLEGNGKYEAAEEALREALRLGTEHQQWAAVQASAISLVFVVGKRRARPQEALHYRALAQGLAQGDARALASLHSAVGVALYAQAKYSESETESRRALELMEEALGPDHPLVATSRSHVASVLFAQGKYADAEAEHRQALALREKTLGSKHPDVAASRNNLANMLYHQGKSTQAEEEARRAVALMKLALGPEHPNVATAHNNLANALHGQAKLAEAEEQHRLALAITENALGSDHPDVALPLNNLANALQEQGKNAEAEVQHRKALALWEARLGPEHPNVASSRLNLGNALHAQGKHAEAEAQHRTALGILEKALGPEHPNIALSRINLADTLLAQAKYAEAETEFRRALAISQRALDADHLEVAFSRLGIARALRAQDRNEDALPFAEQAWERLRKDDIPPDYQAHCAFLLAQVRWALRQRSLAKDLAERAAEGFDHAGQAFAEDRDEVTRWLEARG